MGIVIACYMGFPKCSNVISTRTELINQILVCYVMVLGHWALDTAGFGTIGHGHSGPWTHQAVDTMGLPLAKGQQDCCSALFRDAHQAVDTVGLPLAKGQQDQVQHCSEVHHVLSVLNKYYYNHVAGFWIDVCFQH